MGHAVPALTAKKGSVNRPTTLRRAGVPVDAASELKAGSCGAEPGSTGFRRPAIPPQYAVFNQFSRGQSRLPAPAPSAPARSEGSWLGSWVA